MRHVLLHISYCKLHTHTRTHISGDEPLNIEVIYLELWLKREPIFEKTCVWQLKPEIKALSTEACIESSLRNIFQVGFVASIGCFRKTKLMYVCVCVHSEEMKFQPFDRLFGIVWCFKIVVCFICIHLMFTTLKTI